MIHKCVNTARATTHFPLFIFPCTLCVLSFLLLFISTRERAESVVVRASLCRAARAKEYVPLSLSLIQSSGAGRIRNRGPRTETKRSKRIFVWPEGCCIERDARNPRTPADFIYSEKDDEKIEGERERAEQLC